MWANPSSFACPRYTSLVFANASVHTPRMLINVLLRIPLYTIPSVRQQISSPPFTHPSCWRCSHPHRRHPRFPQPHSPHGLRARARGHVPRANEAFWLPRASGHYHHASARGSGPELITQPAWHRPIRPIDFAPNIAVVPPQTFVRFAPL